MREADFERSPGDDTVVVAVAGFTTPGIDFTTNETVNINGFGTREFVGFTGAAAGTYTPCAFRRLQLSHRRQDADHWDDQRRHRNFADPLARKTGFLATNEVPIFGLSYTSTDGVTFNQNATFNFRFSLVLSTPPHAVRERRKG